MPSICFEKASQSFGVDFNENDQSFGVDFDENDQSFDAKFGEVTDLSEGQKAVAYQDGYTKGHTEGRKAGYAEGSTDGFDQGYAKAAEEGQALLSGSITELNSEASSVHGYACYRRLDLVSVNFPRATKVNLYGFEGCTKLEEVYLPEALSFGNKVFYNCKALREVYVPKATSFSIECFSGCTSLERIDLPCVTSLSRDVFNGCTNLRTLILRANQKVSEASSNVLEATAIAAGNGYVYVPKALVDTYKADAGWGVYAEQIRAIEDYPEI